MTDTYYDQALMDEKTERFEMRVTGCFLKVIDGWRCRRIQDHRLAKASAKPARKVKAHR